MAWRLLRAQVQVQVHDRFPLARTQHLPYVFGTHATGSVRVSTDKAPRSPPAGLFISAAQIEVIHRSGF